VKRAPWLVLLLCAAAAAQGRWIVIGVDGMDYEVCREMIAAGELPALAALAQAGSFVPLEPTNPAQSPVSWATITTGLNPGRTGIFDFIRREFRPDGGIAAELALSKLAPVGPFRENPGRAALIALLAAAAAAAIVAIVAVSARRYVIAAIALTAATGLAFAAFVDEVHGEVAGALSGAFEAKAPVNAREGRAIWERLDDAGIRTMSVLAPVAFPAPSLRHGHLICGLGVPDAMGTPGTYTEYRGDPIPRERAITQTGCRLKTVSADQGGRLDGVSVPGPKRGATGERLEAAVGVHVDRASRTVRFDLGGESCTVGERQWSPFLATRFELPWFQSLPVLTRFRVVEAGERIAIHQEPTCFDPRDQNRFLAITSPIEFGDEVCPDGPFDTCGWGCATNPMQDEVIDEETFLSDIEEMERQRYYLLARTLKTPDWRLFFCVLSTPDRVQHMFWRDRDPAHARHDPAAIARRGDPIKDCYRRIDGLVARLQAELLKPDDVLLVVSDHGFAPFRWQVNLNRFLAEEGFLAGTGDRTERRLETSLGGASLFQGIDWSRTRAYSLGLGKIYVNLQGEPGGIVPPAERRALLEDVRKRLLALRHEGKPVVRSAAFREELYEGDHVRGSADLVIGFERGFRVSWQCTLGSLDEPVISENRNLWSGDHCSVDPGLVPGVLFSSRPLAQDRASVADICPTIETQLGVPAPAEQDGRPLRFR
jgi:predicted AlkP superfamily phosphohydrolase/phosphomutase